MSVASCARMTVAIGLLLGMLQLGGCADSTSRAALIDAGSDVAMASNTVPATTTTTSTATSTDGGLVDPSPDAPWVVEAPGAVDCGSLDRSSDEPMSDVSSDLSDGGCPAGQYMSYATPGCGAAAQPVCVDDTLGTCAMLNYYCECDGVTTHMVGGCGGVSDKPYLHQGACKVDAAIDAEAPCRMELEVFTCQPGWTSMLCCPPAFDGTLATVPGCDPENLDESTSAGDCDGLKVLLRVSLTGGTISCSYAASAELVGTSVREGSDMVIPFCMTSRTAIAGEATPTACDPASLPLIRNCTR